MKNKFIYYLKSIFLVISLFIIISTILQICFSWYCQECNQCSFAELENILLFDSWVLNNIHMFVVISVIYLSFYFSEKNTKRFFNRLFKLNWKKFCVICITGFIFFLSAIFTATWCFDQPINHNIAGDSFVLIMCYFMRHYDIWK